MLRSVPSAIDDALDTLYEPNAVFTQFLRSASMTFFLFSFPWFFLSCLFSLFFSFLFFRFLFRFFAFLSFLSFSSSSFLFYVSFFQWTSVVVRMVLRAIYVVVLPGVASGIVRFSRRE